MYIDEIRITSGLLVILIELTFNAKKNPADIKGDSCTMMQVRFYDAWLDKLEHKRKLCNISLVL